MFSVVFLVGVGFFIWGIITGRIHIGAVTIYPQSISGKVYDRAGNPISSIKITDTKTGDYVTSSSTGSYSIGVPTGEVVLSYEKDGTKYPVGYSDVPSGFWAEKWIGALKSAGIVSGYPDGTFHPSEEVTRAQMAVFLARALARGDANVKASGTQKYSDVPTTYWAYKYIDYLYNNTTIRGYPDGTFKPEEKVTRAQLAVFICKALNLEPYDKIEPSFPDVKKDYWAYGYIERVNYMGIAMGYPDGKYYPENKVTRDQMCVFIGRAFSEIPTTNNGYNYKVVHYYITSGQSSSFSNVYLSKCGQFGRVEGTLKTTAGVKLSNVKVFLTQMPTLNEEYLTTTDSSGKYKLFNIPAGFWGYFIKDTTQKRSYYSEKLWENMVIVESNKTTILSLSDLKY